MGKDSHNFTFSAMSRRPLSSYDNDKTWENNRALCNQNLNEFNRDILIM